MTEQTRFEKAAREAIEQLYDDPRYETLADRVEEIVELLDSNPGDERLHKRRMHQTRIWKVVVYGSGETFTLFWEMEESTPWVRWAAMRDI